MKAMEYEEIRKATSNFRADSMLGYYRRNRVYKGWIDENYVAAVKPGSGIAVAVTVEYGCDPGFAYWLVGFVPLAFVLDTHSCLMF